jgi:hypothetical protein
MTAKIRKNKCDDASGHIMTTIKDKLISVFTDTYTPDSIDMVNRTFNGSPFSNKKIPGKNAGWVTYSSSPVIMISSFFGLPNRCAPGTKPSWLTIAKNLIGWQDNKSLPRSIFNALLSPLALTWNLAAAIFKTAVNTAKLATEFLPSLLLTFLTHQNNDESQHDKDLRLKPAILKTLEATAHILLFAGKALTSPINNIRRAWKLGTVLAGKSVSGKILGGSLALLSAGITIVAYSFALPLVISVVGPAIISKMSVSLGQFAAPAMNVLSAAVSWIGSQVVMPVFGQVFVSLGMSVSPVIAGAVTLGTFGLTSLGTALDRLISPFKEWWSHSAKRVVNKATTIAAQPSISAYASPQPMRLIPTHSTLRNQLPRHHVTHTTSTLASRGIDRIKEKPAETIAYPFETESFIGSRAAFFSTNSSLSTPNAVEADNKMTNANHSTDPNVSRQTTIGFKVTNWG